MNQKNKCHRCSKEYRVDEWDLNFLKKISPKLDNEVHSIDSPKLCFDCRMTTLMAWRNERNLHPLACSCCGKDIISVFSKENNYKVLCSECFWSDKVDPHLSSTTYDKKKSFFDQFDVLLHNAKLLTLYAANNENCEYVNQESDDNNCYLCIGGYGNQDCYHCTYSLASRKCIDCLGITDSENLYECTMCFSCYNCQHLYNCTNCRDCYFCEDCVGCENCFGSINLRYKKYYFFNEQLDKKEYKRKVAEYLGSREGIVAAKSKFAEHRLDFVFKYSFRFFCDESCDGDILIQCKDVQNTYYSAGAQNTKNSYIINQIKDVLDGLAVGRGELVYYSGSSISLFGSAFCSSCYTLRNSYYCFMCYNSNDLFGCVGLNHKQYCIFNKQYTKQEYEKEVARIISEMRKKSEWGEFFPIGMSPFGYNESMAMEYYPKDRQEIKKIKANWREEDIQKINSNIYKPKDISQYHIDNNEDAESEIDKCINGILKCEESGRPFRIISRELAQYIERNIQLPRLHPNLRHRDRLGKLCKIKLYHRKCMNEGPSFAGTTDGRCTNEFETTYAPERPEKVYCESCYQKEII